MSRSSKTPRVALMVLLAGLLLAACGGQGAEAIRSRLPSTLPSLPSRPPTTEAPTTEAPTTEAPTTEAPTTEAPTTEAPTTEAPTTEAPTTEPPTTEAPTTEPPTTEPPTTEPPTTEPPTTEPPTTEPPTTEPPTEAAGPTPAPTSTEPASAESDSFPWGWLLLGLAVVATVLIIASSRSRRSARAAWRDRALRVYSTGTALHDGLSVTLTGASGADLSAPADPARWSEFDRLAGQMAQELPGLEAAPPSDQASTAVANLSMGLAAIRSAVQTLRSTGDPETLSVVRGRMEDFESSLRSFRALLS